MSREVSPSTNRAYGVVMVSRLWRIARATVYLHRYPAASANSPSSASGVKASATTASRLRPAGPLPTIRSHSAPQAGPIWWADAALRKGEGMLRNECQGAVAL